MRDSSLSKEKVLDQLARGMEVWYNFTGDVECLDLYYMKSAENQLRMAPRLHPYDKPPTWRFAWWFQVKAHSCCSKMFEFSTKNTIFGYF